MKRFLAAESLSQLTALEVEGAVGVYFGSEFCAHRLASHEETRAARNWCEKRELAFVPVTPIATEEVFDKVCEWAAKAAAGGGEWVANDLGVLKWASGHRMIGSVTAGRMLSRQQRGPRLAKMLRDADETLRERLIGSSWDDPFTLALFMGMGVRRFSLDAVPWGVNRPPLPIGTELVVHAPWAAVTWSPSCHFKVGEGKGCAAPCRQAQPLRMENDEDPTPLWTRGNALFTRMDDAEAEKIAKDAGAVRFVWSEGMPA